MHSGKKNASLLWHLHSEWTLKRVVRFWLKHGDWWALRTGMALSSWMSSHKWQRELLIVDDGYSCLFFFQTASHSYLSKDVCPLLHAGQLIATHSVSTLYKVWHCNKDRNWPTPWRTWEAKTCSGNMNNILWWYMWAINNVQKESEESAWISTAVKPCGVKGGDELREERRTSVVSRRTHSTSV